MRSKPHPQLLTHFQHSVAILLHQSAIKYHRGCRQIFKLLAYILEQQGGARREWVVCCRDMFHLCRCCKSMSYGQDPEYSLIYIRSVVYVRRACMYRGWFDQWGVRGFNVRAGRIRCAPSEKRLSGGCGVRALTGTGEVRWRLFRWPDTGVTRECNESGSVGKMECRCAGFGVDYLQILDPVGIPLILRGWLGGWR